MQRYKIAGVSEFAKEMEEKGLGKPKVSLQFELSQSGITELIKAEAAVEENYTVVEDVEVDDEEAESEDEKKEEDEKQEEGEDSENATETKKEKKKKTIQVEKVRDYGWMDALSFD